jgi:phospho-N-acetylmuramoyl-pentapeptide-transferase
MEIPTLFNELSKDLGLILGSSFLGFIIVLIATPKYTELLKKFQFGQSIKEESMGGTKTPLFHSLHKNKTGTPTMGGVLIWASVVIVCLLSFLSVALGITNNHLISRSETYLPLFTLVTCALLGLVDDIMNAKKIGKTKGLTAITKFTWLTLFSAFGAYWFHYKLGYNSITLFAQSYEIGWLYIPLFMFVVVGSANAVNFTDGLDGLAAGLVILAFGALGVVAFIKGLLILAAFCALIIGSTAAFLWYNIPPAKFFMGDTGSLALGATMAVIAFLTDTVLLLPFIGFIFVIETLSIILQLTSKKLFGKKIFYIAPIHHHFEYIGWPEFKVTMRFWLIGGFVAALGMILHLGRLV